MSLGNALLGLINYRPMTGYDLKRIFDDTVDFFWSAQMSQIYRELNKLEEKGLVKSTIETQEKRPDRKVYQLRKSYQHRGDLTGEHAFSDMGQLILLVVYLIV